MFLVLAAAAFAEPFHWDTPGGRVQVDRWALPDTLGTEAHRVCSYDVVLDRGRIGLVPQLEPPEIASSCQAVASGWAFTCAADCPDDGSLVRLSFILPAAVDNRSAVTVYPLAPDILGIVTPAEIDELTTRPTHSIHGASFSLVLGRDKGELVFDGSGVEECVVDVVIDLFGRPQANEVHGCDARLHAQARDEALRGRTWRREHLDGVPRVRKTQESVRLRAAPPVIALDEPDIRLRASYDVGSEHP